MLDKLQEEYEIPDEKLSYSELKDRRLLLRFLQKNG
jgi:hypothetical protein